MNNLSERDREIYNTLSEARTVNTLILENGGLNYDIWWDRLIKSQQNIAKTLRLLKEKSDRIQELENTISELCELIDWLRK